MHSKSCGVHLHIYDASYESSFSFMGKIGWNGVVYMWSAFMLLGFAVTVYRGINDKKQNAV